MVASSSFLVRATREDWQNESGSWHVPALKIPGAKIEKVFVDGGEANPDSYNLIEGQELLRWKDRSNAPSAATIAVTLTKSLSTTDETGFWKRLAVLMPLFTALVSATLTYILKPTEDLHLVDGWRISGNMKVEGSKRPDTAVARLYVSPPTSHVFPGGRFEITNAPSPLQPANASQSRLLIELNGFKPAAFDLTESPRLVPGSKPPTVRIDEKLRVVTIIDPIELQELPSGDTPYQPTVKPILIP